MAERLQGLIQPPVWNSEEDHRLVCRMIVDETHDVKTFVFTAPEPKLYNFAPGQFLTFEFDIAGRKINRCYTIATSPTRPRCMCITVKRHPGGIVSNFLHDHMKVGDLVHGVGPMGEFSPFRFPAAKRLFISGGSGITPLMSMSRFDFDMGEDNDTVFLHAARTPRDIIFRTELEVMAERMHRLKVAHIVESAAGEKAWPGARGRISRAFIELSAPDFLGRDVFCCGPQPFMAAVRRILADAGFDMARYHEESFDFAVMSEAAGEAEAAQGEAGTGKIHKITFSRSNRVIECDENTHILAAARAGGLRLPSSCTRGLCGTCKSKKSSGDVEMVHSGGIRQREIDNGLVLICCSKPRSDVTIDR